MERESRYALAEFATHAHDHLARLKATGQPEILTLEGEGEVVVQDTSAYQILLDRLDALETVAAARESMAEYGRNEGVAAREGLDSLRDKHGIPRKA